ncbi:hypothetical protein [Agromyces mangrovi Wang et al. 2018]|uniref:hypothetical protein n=1 Tax=Agromyces mangrovi TaxID=1858653 RepID=UPI002573083F|nr:hypothetical protein [Agromyces mangrovi]
MDTSTAGTYTAKLTDGPLEGKTITVSFLDSGDPNPRLEIPAESGGKHYVYSRGSGVEFDAEHANRPSSVSYRFIETVFD